MAGKYDRQNDFIRRTYDRLPIVIPKGSKSQLRELACEHGLSVNAFVWSLIKAELDCMNQD